MKTPKFFPYNEQSKYRRESYVFFSHMGWGDTHHLPIEVFDKLENFMASTSDWKAYETLQLAMSEYEKAITK